MKWLIINADDLGADEARNEGIFEAIRKNRVTSASILANGPALTDALQLIQSLAQPRISWGFHLNLSEGIPLSPGLRLLTGGDGCFLGKARAHSLLSRHGDRELEKEVKQEIEAQIQALQRTGIRISHIDGHQHVHVFPAVLQAAMETVQEHRVPWVRIPKEDPGSAAESVPDSLLAEAKNLGRIAQEASVRVRGRGVRVTDHFRGLYLKGRLTLPLLEEILRDLPPGLTEFMVHPGRVPTAPISTPFSAFSIAAREKELETLLADGFQMALVRNEIELTPFPEVGN